MTVGQFPSLESLLYCIVLCSYKDKMPPQIVLHASSQHTIDYRAESGYPPTASGQRPKPLTEEARLVQCDAGSIHSKVLKSPLPCTCESGENCWNCWKRAQRTDFVDFVPHVFPDEVKRTFSPEYTNVVPRLSEFAR